MTWLFMFFVLLLESTDPSMEPCCKGIQANATMKAFLIAHSRQVDPSLPDGNCLFHSLYVKNTKNDWWPNKTCRPQRTSHWLTSSLKTPGRGWTVGNCSLKEHLVKVAKHCQCTLEWVSCYVDWLFWHSEAAALFSSCLPNCPNLGGTSSLNWTKYTVNDV